MGKGLALFVIGEKSMEHGMNILGAHIDSPRMDLKQDPLYEDTDFAMLDTHYYGGIKKYQWVTLPLALHGVIAKKDGTVVKVSVGDKPGDPVFGVSDLLIQLSGEQMEKKANKVIEGENLDVLVGSKPLEGKEKDAVKEGILEILKEKYDMTEEDFMSAEIEVVPAGHAREAGLDHSMVMSYGLYTCRSDTSGLLFVCKQTTGCFFYFLHFQHRCQRCRCADVWQTPACFHPM